MIKITPSILSADFARLGEGIALLEEIGADMIHIDVMDGHFVPNLTIGPPVVRALRGLTDLPFDVHLMMTNPMEHVDAFIDAGATSISIHAEVLPHLHRAVCTLKEKGVRAAVALNPSTPLHVLEYVLSDVDMVLLMTVNPGFGGQSFIPAMLDKIKVLRDTFNRLNLDTDIQIDGGISLENIYAVTEAGANIIVSGSSIFGAPDPKKMLEMLKQKAFQ